MMLTLEPVSMAGVRTGVDQLKGTALGGLIGFAVVWAGGVNVLTVPLAVSLTLYMALRIEWRTVPAVAIFTAIYMTQYIQYDTMGMPSMPLTLALRLSALFSGILVAIIVNAVFSKLFYRRMITKRLVYTLEQLSDTCMTVREANEISAFKAFGDITGDLAVLDRMLIDLKLRGHDSLKQYYQGIINDLFKMVHFMRTLILDGNADPAFLSASAQQLRALSVTMEAQLPKPEAHLTPSEADDAIKIEVMHLLTHIDEQIREIKQMERSD
jgi:hypothetical protein